MIQCTISIVERASRHHPYWDHSCQATAWSQCCHAIPTVSTCGCDVIDLAYAVDTEQVIVLADYLLCTPSVGDNLLRGWLLDKPFLSK